MRSNTRSAVQSDWLLEASSHLLQVFSRCRKSTRCHRRHRVRLGDPWSSSFRRRLKIRYHLCKNYQSGTRRSLGQFLWHANNFFSERASRAWSHLCSVCRSEEGGNEKHAKHMIYRWREALFLEERKSLTIIGT